MISTNFSYEIVNTSYLKNVTDNMHIKLDNQNVTTKKNKNSIDNKLSIVISQKI
jgi:hypothetical protein